MLTIIKGSSDLSQALENYLTDVEALDFSSGETLDIGFRKPFSDLFIELKPTTVVANVLQAEYFNGSWTSLSITDRTKGFNRSGFVKWDKSEIEDWEAVTLHGKELYWVRVSLQNDITDLEFSGINIVFSDDNDLKEGYPDIMEFLPENSQSFIAYHQEARNHILTYLRNKGKTISQQQRYKLLDQFDLHNVEEVRQAAKYLALSNIFYNESDVVGDKWFQKAEGFKSKYGEAINLYSLSIDENDNGKEENSESNAIQYIRIQRL